MNFKVRLALCVLRCERFSSPLLLVCCRHHHSQTAIEILEKSWIEEEWRCWASALHFAHSEISDHQNQLMDEHSHDLIEEKLSLMILNRQSGVSSGQMLTEEWWDAARNRRFNFCVRNNNNVNDNHETVWLVPLQVHRQVNKIHVNSSTVKMVVNLNSLTSVNLQHWDNRNCVMVKQCFVCVTNFHVTIKFSHECDKTLTLFAIKSYVKVKVHSRLHHHLIKSHT